MADGDLHASIAPFQRYYLCIDGTGTEDSVEYGRLLEEKFGWRNLCAEFLEPDPNAAKGDERLVDPNHPFLPICTFPAAGRKKPIAVVCPGGRNGRGLDAFWEKYNGETPDEKANNGRHEFSKPGVSGSAVRFGRHSAADKCSRFMNDLILVPAIEKVTDAQGKSFGQLKDGLLSGVRNPTEPDVPAELLIVSSHGWLGGFMRGDNLRPSTVAQPVDAQGEFFPDFVYFLVGEAVSRNLFFVGPKWVILAQCSTVNNATWLMWVKLMASGIPPVRGILGYEEVSPGVSGSIQIARQFFANLDAGQPLLKAWRGANAGQKWAAIVHREAVGDLMRKWDVFADFTSVQVTATDSSYLAFGASLERGSRPITNGKPVLDVPPPFGLAVGRFFLAEPNATPPLPEEFVEITEDTLDRGRAKFVADARVRTIITPPAGAKITSATVRWVHMRETHSTQPSLSVLFQSIAAIPDGSLVLTPSSATSNTLKVQPAAPTDRITIEWIVQKQPVLDRSGLERDHSFLWPLITIEMVGGPKPSESFPFSTRGLLF